MKYRRLSVPSDGFYYVESDTLVVNGVGTKVFVLKKTFVYIPGSIITVTAVDEVGSYMIGPAISLVGLLLTVNVTVASGPDAQRWIINTQQPLAQGDMLFGASNNNFLHDSPDTVAQAVWTRLQLWAGEWFLDDSEGTQYLRGVFGVGGRQQLEPIMRDRISTTEGVLSITSLSTGSDPDARTAFVSAEIETVFGTAALEGNA